MTMVYSFTSKTLTPSQNHGSGASGHWAARHRTKKAMQKAWAWDIAISLMPTRPETLPRARVTISRHSVGTLDKDNLEGGVKALVDVLKPASKRNPHGMGLIADDNPAVLALDVRQVREKRRADQRVVVIVEPWHPQEPVA